MEWNTKWDWENHEIFNSKVIEEEIDGSFNLSSDVVNNSSISASTESSLKEGIKVFAGGLPESYRNKKELAGAGTAASPAMEGSVSSGELFIGLKLGKRTYFENSFVKGSSKVSSFSDVSGKKVKSSCQSMVIPLCQVEGCNLDLSSAKEYHRKHRVCESHSKCPKVVVGGLERRFCQQCSRFHSLSEFDEKKRSCRRRLSDHNARRRKPQQETIHFNSSSLSSSFYDGTQQLSFVLNNAPLIQTRPVVNSTWENTSKADKCGVGDGMSLELPNGVNKPTTLAFNGLVPSKGTRGEVLDQGFKESLSSDVDALDIRRALSLLSNDSWGGGVCDPPDLMHHHHHHHHHNHNNNNPNVLHIQQPLPQGLFPLSSPEYWHNEQQHSIDNPHKTIISNATNNNTQFQDFHLFNRFYSNPIDEILKPL